MTKRQNKSNHLLKNKIVIAVGLLMLIGFVIFVGVRNHKSPIQRKLMGFWNIELENSYWERDGICDFIGCIIHFENKNIINLPHIYDTVGAIDFQGKTSLELDDDFWTAEIIARGKKHSEEMQRKAKGTWTIISTNPDSVFFNVPEHPLHGKYAIRFFIDENGWLGMSNNIYKIELKNDSTYLICNKGSFIFTKDVKKWNN